MIKIYRTGTNDVIAEAQTLEMASELIDTLGALYGALEVR